MAVDSPLNRVRLEIGDSADAEEDGVVDNPLFSDDQIEMKLADRGGNVLLAAADLCDILATRFAGDFDFEWDGSTDARGKFSRSQKSAAYAARAKALRARAATDVSADNPYAGSVYYSFPDPANLVF